MREYLKTKIKTLASESKHIRLAERHTLENARKNLHGFEKKDKTFREPNLEYSAEFYNLYQNLRAHRVNIVRKEARASLLAYGFMNGREYADMEENIHELPDWERVERCVKAFHPEWETPKVKQQFEEWLQVAKGIATLPVKVSKAA